MLRYSHHQGLRFERLIVRMHVGVRPVNVGGIPRDGATMVRGTSRSLAWDQSFLAENVVNGTLLPNQ